ncbi:PREDICTED: lysoplasmalogenase-like protein TMEM86A isoform X1 [Nicrophorus vespilloides]|uniref:lysoplasmalogenase n=1 Tax=Nicrophorus vespilloides TaxID=110193 RepID=A0ABM1MVK7_NICVS|nr:PREDICTED: lysoplasmalogenase-like protein TMEM86A isoform X1 [Nicrophorus vespilloides]
MITVILKLVPFFAAIILYFSVFIPHTEPTYLAALIKCLPIITLMIFVVWYSKFSNVRVQAYGRRIFFGLLFSCIGDYCLIWPDYFPLGMLSFAIGHINYITAFGFSTRNLPVAVVTYTITALGCLYLMPGLTGILIPGVPIYSIILNTMMWRAVSRMNNGVMMIDLKYFTKRQKLAKSNLKSHILKTIVLLNIIINMGPSSSISETDHFYENIDCNRGSVLRGIRFDNRIG